MKQAVRSLLLADTVAGQFLRFLMVGAVAFVVDLGVLVLLTKVLGLHYLFSAALSFCCGMIVTYALSIAWVFNNRSLASKKAEFAIFSIVGLVGLAWTVLLMYLGTGIVGLDYKLSKIITVAIVLFWNFGMRKIILFSSPTKLPGEQ